MRPEEKGASHCPFLLLAGSRPEKLAEPKVKIYTSFCGLRPAQGKAVIHVKLQQRRSVVLCVVQRTGQPRTGTDAVN